MATQSDHDPLLAEGLRVLEETPGLEDELTEFGRRQDSGEIPQSELHTTKEVLRRLARVRATRVVE